MKKAKAATAKPATGKPAKKQAVVHSSKTVYRGDVFWITRDKITEPDGVEGTRDVIRHNGSVVILAVDVAGNPQDPSIVVERQYRHAAGQYLLELPAGRIEPGEAPLAAAKRELIEETGYRAKKWSRLVQYYASPGFLGETMKVFLAEEIREGVAQPEEDEKIEILRIPLSQLLQMVASGKILDGKTIVAVLLYAARRSA